MVSAPQLVLSMFPGADLLGRAFEARGCSVVRGPEILLGQDVREWTEPPAGRFDGLIAGPPCQPYSQVRQIGGHDAKHGDFVPYCFELAARLGVKWAAVENVPLVINEHDAPPGWGALMLNDWHCGGQTQRQRLFYIFPRDLVAAIPVPLERAGKGAYSVLASSNKPARGGRPRHGSLSPRDAGRLQGYPEIADRLLAEADIGVKGHRLIGARLIVHYLGNGVPRAMGDFLAGHLLAAVSGARR